jgi:hypothetical protein
METIPPLAEPNSAAPTVEASIPGDGSENVPIDTLIALRFSKLLLVTTVNSGSVTLTGPSGPIAATITPAENGILGFVIPQSKLLPGTPYTFTLRGLTEPNGNPLPETFVRFTTAGSPPEPIGIPLGPGGSTSGSEANGADSKLEKNPRSRQARVSLLLLGKLSN